MVLPFASGTQLWARIRSRYLPVFHQYFCAEKCRVFDGGVTLNRYTPAKKSTEIPKFGYRVLSAPLGTLDRAYRVVPWCVSPVTGVGHFASNLRCSTKG